MAPQLLIATRFGLGIRDKDWFRHRLILLSSITIPSLLAQRDQNFVWVLFVNSGLSHTIKTDLERMLAPFGDRAILTFGGHNSATLLALARSRGLSDADGYVLTGRIDDDDAWDVRTVATVRERAAAWLRDRSDTAPGLAMTFEEGLVWVMYEMIDIDCLQRRGEECTRPPTVRRYVYPFTSISAFICSKVIGEVATLGVGQAAASHSKVPRLLSDRGFDVDVITTNEPMWLYCRHKQATSAVQRAASENALDVTLDDMASSFGLDREKVEQYISSADEHGYSVVKRNFGLRGQLRTALQDADERLSNPKIGEIERVRLELERDQLKRDLNRIADNVIGDPQEALERPRVSD
jgi:Putative rhamnosyl transferase